MKHVYIYCEGPTEESFINEILYFYLFEKDVIVRPIVCTTKRTASKKYTGGVRDYNKIRHEMLTLCKSHKKQYVTTMFDYYGMPNNTPEIGLQDKDIYTRIAKIEAAIDQDIGQDNFMFHFMLHEFEGILFSEPEAFSLISGNEVINEIRKIRENYPNPEYINNSPNTAPSKRLEKLIPKYSKIKNGTLLSKKIGIEIILRECPHFREWVDKILNLP